MREMKSQSQVYLWLKATDMRKSFDTLLEVVKSHNKNVYEAGAYFVFFGRNKDRVKILYWDEDGIALWYKRLEAGTFKVKSENETEIITGIDLKKLLLGVELSRIKMQKKNEKVLC
jgi:transposase